MGDDFIKFYVCMYNKWNPYSDDVRNVPWIYWILAFNFIQIENRHEWEGKLQPHAELISQIVNPETYSVYHKHKKKRIKSGAVEPGKEYYKDTIDGVEGAGAANAYYDPNRGLVDDTGKVIVSKDQYDEMLGLNGVAISW